MRKFHSNVEGQSRGFTGHHRGNNAKRSFKRLAVRQLRYDGRDDILEQLTDLERQQDWDEEDKQAEIDAAWQREEDELYQWQLDECEKLRAHYGDNFDEYAYWDDGYAKWKERQGLNPLSLKDERIW